ncbi:MAG: cytochrome c-type biogenesis protein CcmH [Anaerolineae bacterium]|nr:cytochrome c-type biogenesis protein CcmH [Anaerolineae bacterium]
MIGGNQTRTIAFLKHMLLMLSVLGCMAVAVSAQEIAGSPPTTENASVNAQRTMPLTRTPTPHEINEVARQLWCPLCAGVRLDACELKACAQMKEVIAIKLSQGATPEEIKAYFVEQYGPQVLGEPPRKGFTLLAWVLPFAALAAGAGWLIYQGRRWALRGRAARTATARATLETTEDAYAKRLEEELKRLD